jgi:hypothetical protein
LFESNIAESGISRFRHRKITILESTIREKYAAEVKFRQVTLFKDAGLELACDVIIESNALEHFFMNK